MVILQDTKDQVIICHQGVNIVISALTVGERAGDVVIYATKPLKYAEDVIVPMEVCALPYTDQVMIRRTMFDNE